MLDELDAQQRIGAAGGAAIDRPAASTAENEGCERERSGVDGGVAAGAAGEHIVAAAAGEPVGEGIADEDVAGAAADDVLNVGELSDAGGVWGDCAEIDVHRAGTAAVVERVDTATAWQMIAAGIANFLVAFALGDLTRAVWTVRGVSAMLYLVVFGSWVGYTAYIWLLNHVPTSKVSTYAYVNPVVAVFLGWLVLHERVDSYIIAGSAVVVASVALVTSAQVTAKTVIEEMPAVETMGD